MTNYNPMREIPGPAGYKAGDVFILFGELFGRGYANGIVEEAHRAGMTVLGITVGRRDASGLLRPLTDEELTEAEANLGGRIINIPLEAGFDMEPGSSGVSPVERLKGVKTDEWDKLALDWDAIEQCRLAGITRFTDNLNAVVAELDAAIPVGANVLFAHTMAGGIPRARIYMPLLNRIFKGQGERYLPSEAFWKSDLGRLCSISFDEVTANTFNRLIEATAGLRAKINIWNGQASYVAYCYHGCEVLIKGAYSWQSYAPYLQGWAKMLLEDIATEAWAQGIKATVFNCPEIQTNSSALFLGVEISLYPLLSALDLEGGGPRAEEIKRKCRELLKEGATLEDLLAGAESYLSGPELADFMDFASWPRHNTAAQSEHMLNCATGLLELNRDPKEIVCAELSRAVFRAVGTLMFKTAWKPEAPVFWLNHDICAKQVVAEG